MKWWLVEDEVVETVRRALKMAHATFGTSVVMTYCDALQILELGLHDTKYMPQGVRARGRKGVRNG